MHKSFLFVIELLYIQKGKNVSVIFEEEEYMQKWYLYLKKNINKKERILYYILIKIR